MTNPCLFHRISKVACCADEIREPNIALGRREKKS